MLVMQLGNRIFGKLMTYPMYNYALFTSILGVFVYIPISFAYIVPVQLWTDWIGKEQTDIPKMSFAVMGFFDTVAGIMSAFSVNYISNASLIVLVQQSAIPISMVISKNMLGATYTKSQYFGAGVVLAGIAVVLAPSFFTTPAPAGASSDGAADPSGGGQNEMLWISILVLSCIPMCLSSVYKEKALGEVEIDVVYLNGWVAIYQFLFAIPLTFPSASLISLPYDEIMGNFYGGFLCWMGTNTIMPGNDAGLPPDDCTMGPLYLNSYLVFNIIFNLLIVVILKHGSANIMWMASTVIVPLSNVAFAMPWMPHSQPMKVWDFVGLVVIMLGLVIYRFTQAIVSLWHHAMQTVTKEELADEKLGKVIDTKVNKQQLRYIGLNQMEALNAIVDTRISNERKKVVHRSPGQIRNNLLVKLGLPASPLITAGARSRGVGSSPGSQSSRFGSGPSMERRYSESWDKIKQKSTPQSIPSRDSPRFSSSLAASSSATIVLPRPSMASSMNTNPRNGQIMAESIGSGIAMTVSPIKEANEGV